MMLMENETNDLHPEFVLKCLRVEDIRKEKLAEAISGLSKG